MSFTSLLRRAATVAVVAAVASVVVAAPAQAAIPSGSGWSGSWRYYSSDSFEFAATLPGVKVQGYGLDESGERGAMATIYDTADDYRCARVVLIVPGQGQIDAATECTPGAAITIGDFDAGLDGYLYVILYRTYEIGGEVDKQINLVIPPSKDDAGLRTPDTGASWKYTSGSQFTYSVRRNGVFVTGNGAHQGNTRSAFSAVQKTKDYVGCATGKVSSKGLAKSGQRCGAMGVNVFNEDGFEGGIMVDGCMAPTWGVKRCLSTTVPKPM